jgi:hypothetical protein
VNVRVAVEVSVEVIVGVGVGEGVEVRVGLGLEVGTGVFWTGGGSTWQGGKPGSPQVGGGGGCGVSVQTAPTGQADCARAGVVLSMRPAIVQHTNARIKSGNFF